MENFGSLERQNIGYLNIVTILKYCWGSIKFDTIVGNVKLIYQKLLYTNFLCKHKM